MYTYRAMVKRVVDGDTIDVLVDLGFDVHIRQRLRLYGINTPETRGKTREAGLKSKDFVIQWIGQHQGIVIKTFKDKRGKFGRMLAVINGPGTGLSLNDELTDRGLAEPYFGGRRK